MCVCVFACASVNVLNFELKLLQADCLLMLIELLRLLLDRQPPHINYRSSTSHRQFRPLNCSNRWHLLSCDRVRWSRHRSRKYCRCHLKCHCRLLLCNCWPFCRCCCACADGVYCLFAGIAGDGNFLYSCYFCNALDCCANAVNVANVISMSDPSILMCIDKVVAVNFVVWFRLRWLHYRRRHHTCDGNYSLLVGHCPNWLGSEAMVAAAMSMRRSCCTFDPNCHISDWCHCSHGTLDIQWNVRDSMDSVNGNFSMFVDAVDSTMCRLCSAWVADDLKSGVHCLPIHWLCTELDCCRNFRHIDAGLASMANSRLVHHHTIRLPEPLNCKFKGKTNEIMTHNQRNQFWLFEMSGSYLWWFGMPVFGQGAAATRRIEPGLVGT